MTRVIRDPKLATNDAGNPLERPQFRGEAERARAGEQTGFQATKLVAVEFGRASGPTYAAQASRAVRLPQVIPATGGLARDLQTTHHVCLRTTMSIQSSGANSACLLGRVIHATHRIPFHANEITSIRPFVTRFCKDQ
jgi:hypothetical protein